MTSTDKHPPRQPGAATPPNGELVTDVFAPSLLPLGGYAAPVSAPTSPTELVTCPECGLMAKVEVTKRNSVDFCRNCDFPLFWARATVVSSFGEETGASLRRLPGTAGRAQRASVSCPHCGEPNTPTATHCIRCTLPMVIAAPPPPAPAPPPPLPVVQPEPEPVKNWWWLVIICLCLLAMTIIIAVVTLT